MRAGRCAVARTGLAASLSAPLLQRRWTAGRFDKGEGGFIKPEDRPDWQAASFQKAREEITVPKPCRTEVGEAVAAGPIKPPSNLSKEAQQASMDLDDTHPDFMPTTIGAAQKRPASEGDDEETKAIKKDILDSIREEEVVVFIKGLPEAPVCGFSKSVIQILEALGVEYTSFDVLAHPVVRSYVKEVSGWPTIPQVYLKGNFYGGTDVVTQLAKNGQFMKKLEDLGIKHKKVRF